MNLATLGYGAAALAFVALALLLLVGRRGDPFGYRLAFAAVLSALWAGAAAVAGRAGFANFVPIAATLEIARDAGWMVLLIGVFPRRVPRWLSIVVQVSCVALFAAQVIAWSAPEAQVTHGGLTLAFLGLVLVEQIYRNAGVRERDWLKYLLFGVGGQFAYALFLYAQSELLGTIHHTAWSLRGVLVALAVPPIVLAVRGSVASNASIFISRHVIFYSTAFTAVGTYLVAMAVGGYYVRFVGGDWGDVLQLLFLLGAVAVLISLLWSGTLRRRAREGGSWLVRVSLAATGRFVTDLDLLDAADIAGLPADLPEAEIAALSMQSASPAGMLRHLAPAAAGGAAGKDAPSDVDGVPGIKLAEGGCVKLWSAICDLLPRSAEYTPKLFDHNDPLRRN